MKRIGMTICLAACLVFLLSAPALALNAASGENKAVGAATTGITAGVFFENDVELSAAVFPLELRTSTNGAYIAVAPSFTVTVQGRLVGSVLTAAGGGFQTVNYQNTPGVQVCSGPTSSTYAGFSGVPNSDGISPDGYLFSGVAGGVTFFPIGSDGGTPSLLFTFDGNGLVGDFVIDTACFAPGSHLNYANNVGAPVAVSWTAGTITLLADLCPTEPTFTDAVINVTVGQQAQNQASSSDPDNTGGLGFCEVGNGIGDVSASGLWTYTADCADVGQHQVTVGVGDNANACPCDQASFTVNVNATPLVVSCTDETVHWNPGTASKDVENSVSGGCDPYSYVLLTPEGSLTGSVWDYDGDCGDAFTVQIEVTDDAGQVEICEFDYTATNTAPSCENLAPTLTPQGAPVVIPFAASDADGDALTYSKTSGPAWADFNGNNLEATRPGGETNAETVEYWLSDGCDSVLCSHDLIFENPCISVQDEAGNAYTEVLNGMNATICIVAEHGAVPDDAGGFDLLVCYDQSALSFLGASQPSLADGGPGWEYFTWRTGMFGGNCGGGCPDGFIRLVGIADMNNGVALDPLLFNLDGDILACLTFFVTADRNFINTCPHVGFCSYDCGDNTISSRSGDTLWVPRFDGGVAFGPNYECPEDPKYEFVREISFCGGAICIIEPPDDRGDLNLNGIANEIGDAVLYARYFIYGGTVWNPDATLAQVQILASDINDDGIVLTVADLIYLIRILTGDEQPFPAQPKLSPYANSLDVITDRVNNAVTVRTVGSVELGGAVFVYRYAGLEVGEPELTSGEGMTIRSAARNGELRILVAPDPENPTHLVAGAHNLVRIPVSGDGSMELVEVQASDRSGALLSVNSASVLRPTEYSLHQNYPNPFNAGTVIKVDLKEQSDWSLTIYNVAGQSVRSFSGANDIGVSVTWDGTDESHSPVASGMYFYRLSAGEFTATKKMVLLK